MRCVTISAVFCAGTLAAGAEPLQVNQIYGFDSPQISVIAAVQIGQNTGVAAHQGSAVNIFRANQIGPVASADVTQSGYVNRAAILQIGTTSPFIASGQ
ncbi:hypothetical protein OGR47_05400 [Methylocystis sp. MJC1]|uniref:hypothetical protein n=1 Tax=Methylocystis sp. MJC1 TaxID=2654282 RepID=UPI0013EDE5BC|nr:hypothetical protein [Methylocystis sp. MJC1]KAF2992461.1 hypothetical protein MJC1_00037 [Methylocystis sp. MJC1]MBU6526439.1 hypothetical protein [Methylocystis sp. MJC1]UZX12881.1 hypothetical protein OGR47_05400 [Methylocystis sp. MJC1]